MAESTASYDIRDGELRYRHHGDVFRWSFRIRDVRLIGEYTDDHGLADDYWFVFVAGKPYRVYEGTMYADPNLMDRLSPHVDSRLQAGLAHSTTFNSRIIWPRALEGKPLFTYSGRRRARAPWNWLLDRLLPLVDSEFTPEVMSFLGASSDE